MELVRLLLQLTKEAVDPNKVVIAFLHDLLLTLRQRTVGSIDIQLGLFRDLE
jgi:hypothetical protein